MKNAITITCVAISLVGCVSNTHPICYNKALIYKLKYDIPVFKIEGGRYLSGNPFYTWADKSQFVDTSSCDKLNPQSLPIVAVVCICINEAGRSA